MTLWFEEKIVYPEPLSLQAPNDLPEECLLDFQEAAAINHKSPRAAAALMRACLEKLLFKLTGKSNPNDAIGSMVTKGSISEPVKKACDILRVTGNSALHGYIISPSTEDDNIFPSLAKLLGIIVEDQITKPKEIERLYGMLPEEQRTRIDKRDSGKR